MVPTDAFLDGLVHSGRNETIKLQVSCDSCETFEEDLKLYCIFFYVLAIVYC